MAWLILIITVVVTSLVVFGDLWGRRNQKRHTVPPKGRKS